MKMIEKQRVDGRTFVVTYRLETMKSRLTPAEVTRIQDATRKLRKDSAFDVKLEATSQALAAKGKYRDAIAEAQRLVKLHPKEAMHQLQPATVLMSRRR